MVVEKETGTKDRNYWIVKWKRIRQKLGSVWSCICSRIISWLHGEFELEKGYFGLFTFHPRFHLRPQPNQIPKFIPNVNRMPTGILPLQNSIIEIHHPKGNCRKFALKTIQLSSSLP